MQNILERIFKLKENNTNIKTEILSGITTFFTMSYLLILSPKILENAGLNFYSTLGITGIVVFIASCYMAFIANKPYNQGPFLGDSAFIAYTLVISMGFSINTILAAILISGIIMFFMTLSNLRIKIVNLIPETLKLAYCIGLGLFFIYISLKDIGIVKFTSGLIPVEAGNFTSIPVILGIFCFILLITLVKKNIKGAVIISIFSTVVLGILFKDISLPEKFLSLPYGISNSFCIFDFSNILKKEFIPIFFLLFILINIGTSGALVSILYSDSGNNSLKDIKRPMLADSLAVITASVFGTTTTGVLLDSKTGIESGGRTGLTAVVAGLLFLLGILFTPFISIIPAYAYAPALLYVGILMVSLISKVDFHNISEYSVVLITISVMVLTYNIGIGIMTGFFIYPIIKFLSGEKEQLNLISWIMAVLSLIFFFIYPY